MQTIQTYKKMKKNKEPIVMLTAYDYISGKLAQEAGLDILLIGDSLGMVVLGYDNTLQVTVDDIIHHSRAARRGANDTFIIADLPFMAYHINLEETKRNAGRLILEGKANAVKLEGGSESRLESIRAIVDCEIPVCAHLGLTPQSIHKFGGYKVQGKSDAAYKKIFDQAVAIEQAGAFMVVLEGIPEILGKEISEKLKIPTIGIGAGRYTDGQVMVYHDILTMSDFQPKFVKKYANIAKDITGIFQDYKNEVKDKKFPQKEHVYYPIEDQN